LFLAMDRAPSGASGRMVLAAPDSAFPESLDRAQSDLDTTQLCPPESACDDVAINTLALNSLGRFDLGRPSLVRAQRRTPLWVLASHDYWLASGDHRFVSEQWTFLSNALFADHAATGHTGGAWFAATQAVAALARSRDDSATIARIQPLVAAAERRAQEHPTVFGPAFGLLDADQAEAALTFMVDTVHARWPLATGFLALALYEYHREPEAFALLRNLAQDDGSSAAMFVLPLVRGLIGWDVDAPNRAIAVEPHLPAAWTSVSLTNLRAGIHDVDVSLERDAGTYRIHLTKTTNTPLSLRLAPALPLGARVNSVTVNEADAPIQLEETQHDVHVVIEASFRREVTVEIEFTVPRPRGSVP
jgi:hypothetical protein